MTKKLLMEGNEALCEGAMAAGCRYFFGYPITPQNEIPEYMSWRMPEVGGVFIQAESEIAAINMVMGAAATGARAMTSSSGPGLSLKQEGISYIAACELPCVIVNIVRGGPGLGNISPAQSDYFQATRGGGHGDYRTFVFAPYSIQEMYEFAKLAFDIADRYRNPTLILADQMIGQMIEPLKIDEDYKPNIPPKPWALTGAKGRPKNIINSLFINPQEMEEVNLRINAKYYEAAKKEVRYEAYQTEDAEIILIAYGTCARIAKTVVQEARKINRQVGLLRPITLFPFPSDIIRQFAHQAKAFLVIEMSLGQMVEDVRLATAGKIPVHFYGRTGGMVPTPKMILQELQML